MANSKDPEACKVAAADKAIKAAKPACPLVEKVKAHVDQPRAAVSLLKMARILALSPIKEADGSAQQSETAAG
ncbi:MAG: hypothetical protein GF398_14895 [Chitinivibrionales bacterium]|nr:hypothetical protein [Chitinivibrionales bacterium]